MGKNIELNIGSQFNVSKIILEFYRWWFQIEKIAEKLKTFNLVDFQINILMPSVSFNTQFRISRFAVESGAGGVDRVRLAVEDNAKVFVLHVENMRNNKPDRQISLKPKLC